MTLAAHGEFYPISSHTEAPYQPAALPDYDPSMSSAMAQVFVSSYVLETAGYVYWKANALSGKYARYQLALFLKRGMQSYSQQAWYLLSHQSS